MRSRPCLDRVVRQERIADPGDQGPGGGWGVGARGGQRLGQEGLDLVGGRGVPLEEVAPLGHEGDGVGPIPLPAAGWPGCRLHRHWAHVLHRYWSSYATQPHTVPPDTAGVTRSRLLMVRTRAIGVRSLQRQSLGQGFKEPLELSPPAACRRWRESAESRNRRPLA